VSAMCRKCLASASDEARRCTSCGGRIVKFSEMGEVIEIDFTVGDDQPQMTRGVPPLFGDISNGLPSVAVVNAHAPAAPPVHAPAPPTMPAPSGYTVSPGYTPHATEHPPAAAQHPAAQHPAQNGHLEESDNGLSPPLPMGYYDAIRPAMPPAPPQASARAAMPPAPPPVQQASPH